MKRFIKWFALLVAAVLIITFTYVGIFFPPIMAGMAAKTVCSCVFVAGRTVQSVVDKELTVFPGLASAGLQVNDQDSTVDATILWKKTKAVFRRGLGCTLIAEISADELKKKSFMLASPPLPQDSVPWPTGDSIDTALADNVNREKINSALDHAFEEIDPSKPMNTLAVVVVHNGQIIGERYAPGVDLNSKLMGWSMTKSITNALIGLLIKDNKLTVDAPAPVAEWNSDDRKNITLNNLLQATSGLSWSESYFVPTSTFHGMFILSDDKAKYAAARKLESQPGVTWKYSSGSTNILSRIIRQTLGDSAYYKFPYERIFYKIGMNHTVIESDASGTFVGSSYSYASARDWARFGLLYLNDGVWNGERILPEGWVKYTTTPSMAAKEGQYGALWWLNAGAPGNPSQRKLPELPADAYWADGFEQQWIVVIPSHNLVVVRLGISHHGFDVSKLVNGIIEAL